MDRVCLTLIGLCLFGAASPAAPKAEFFEPDLFQEEFCTEHTVAVTVLRFDDDFRASCVEAARNVGDEEFGADARTNYRRSVVEFSCPVRFWHSIAEKVR